MCFSQNSRNLKSLLAIMASVSLLGCSASKDNEFEEVPAPDIYMKAFRQLEEHDYDKASKAFDEVERQHPYSEWATKGQVMAAYSDFLGRDYDKAIATLDAFIQLHPGYNHIDYVYYLRSLCYYDQILAVSRDQRNTIEALGALEDVVKRFPDSKYGRDAKLKMDLVYDHLAGKEMQVGRYYLSQRQYLAAINRFQVVVDNYQRTTHVPEALHRLVEAYIALNLKDEARSVAAVLGHNYPGSEWYSDTYYLLEGQDMRPEWVKREESGWWERLKNLKLY